MKIKINGKVNVKSIMAQIKKNITMKKKLAGYNEPINFDKKSDLEGIEVLHGLKNIKSERDITSHRKILGKTLIKFRKVLDEEIRRTVDPSLDRQMEFNSEVIRLLSEINDRLKNLEKKKK